MLMRMPGPTQFVTAIVALPLLSSIAMPAPRKSGNPLDHLPKNIEILTHFGERADISPDNARIAFMDKSFGDAFVIDLKTRAIRCLTCNVPGAAFLRVMHLVSGDYILIGPARFSDIHTSRTKDNQLWFLSKQPGSKPVALDQKMSEGAAISKKSMKISYSVTPAQDPSLPAGHSQLFVADVDLSGTSARLTNKHMVYESASKTCTIEAQDFFGNDRKMTFTCYEPGGLASVMTIDLQNGHVENMSKAPGTYNECEGIYPDGLYTNVEADRQVNTLGGKHGSGNIDIWKLRLDGTGKDFKRLTNFNDYEGYKASNPVVSTDGRFMAFQVAHPADEAGVGYGILLYHFQ
jgi:Tol biopolymer transport system component